LHWINEPILVKIRAMDSAAASQHGSQRDVAGATAHAQQGFPSGNPAIF
jgi:hypothetical protein